MFKQDRSSRSVVASGPWCAGARPVTAGRALRRAKRAAVAVAGVVAVLWVIAHLVLLLVVGLMAYAGRLVVW